MKRDDRIEAVVDEKIGEYRLIVTTKGHSTAQVVQLFLELRQAMPKITFDTPERSQLLEDLKNDN